MKLQPNCIISVLKYCKVSKYYDQDCKLNWNSNVAAKTQYCRNKGKSTAWCHSSISVGKKSRVLGTADVKLALDQNLVAAIKFKFI